MFFKYIIELQNFLGAVHMSRASPANSTLSPLMGDYILRGANMKESNMKS